MKQVFENFEELIEYFKEKRRLANDYQIKTAEKILKIIKYMIEEKKEDCRKIMKELAGLSYIKLKIEYQADMYSSQECSYIENKVSGVIFGKFLQ